MERCEYPWYVKVFKVGKKVTIVDLLRQAVFECPLDEFEAHANTDLLRKKGIFSKTSNTNEEEFLKSWARSLCYSHDMFSSYILLTYHCNMKCLYCYEGELHSLAGNMDLQMARQVLKWIQDEVRLNKSGLIDIAFFGGEPLLNRETLSYLADGLKSFSMSRGIKYNFVLVTNGTFLSREVFAELVKNDIRTIQITLDGSSRVHNQLRPTLTGGESYSKIIQNLADNVDAIKQSHMNVIINVNLSLVNSHPDDIEPLLRDLIDLGLQDSIVLSFSEVFCSLRKVPEGPLYEHITEKEHLLSNEIQCLQLANALGFRLDPKYFLRVGACTFKRKGFFAVDPKGDVYKCSSGVGKKEFYIGNVGDSVFDLAKAESKYLNSEPWNNRECIDCGYFPLCLGGCQYQKLIKDGVFEKNCNLFQQKSKLILLNAALHGNCGGTYEK